MQSHDRLADLAASISNFRFCILVSVTISRVVTPSAFHVFQALTSTRTDRVSGGREHALSPEVVGSTADELATNAELADEFITGIFGIEALANERFYSWFSEAEAKLEWQSSTHRLLGAIWFRRFSQLSESDRESLLVSLVSHPTRSIFAVQRALPHFIRLARINASTLKDWLPAIRKRLGNDLENGGLWYSLKVLAEVTPEVAIEVLENWTRDSKSDEKLALAASLLGELRVVIPSSQRFQNIESSWASHPDVKRRIIYFRSWIATANRTPISNEKFSCLLDQMSAGTELEVEEGLNFLRCLLPTQEIADDSFVSGILWIHSHIPPNAGDFWTHHLIVLAKDLHARSCSIDGVKPLCDLIFSVFPPRLENKGTWQELDALLAHLLVEDRAAFKRVLFSIASRDPSALGHAMGSGEGFSHLKGLLLSMGAGTLALEALTSKDMSLRHLGFVLFDALHLRSLPDEAVMNLSDIEVAVMILTLRLEMFLGDTAARFLAALVRRVENGVDWVKVLCSQDIVFHCKDLPGGCRLVFDEIAASSPLVQAALVEVDKYFAELQPCHRSAINSMGIPGLNLAMRMKAERDNRMMAREMEDSSQILSLFPKSFALYGGKAWQTFMHGQLSPVREMSEISHSMEQHRMPAIDLDGMALRRQDAKNRIRSLEERDI